MCIASFPSRRPRPAQASRTIQLVDDCVFFKYLAPRGEAYDKKHKEKLMEGDK